jgi:hypothetical protein
MVTPVALMRVAVLMGAGAVSGCTVEQEARPSAVKHEARAAKALRACPSGPVENYLAERAQKCWYDAPHGRWRTLGHDLHYQTIVAETEASSLNDADEIARRFVEVHGGKFEEILIYVQETSAPKSSLIRRVRWIKGTGYDRLEFVGALRRR